MKKLVLFTVLGSMLLAGCQRNNISSTDQPTIALVLKTLNNPFFIDMQKGAEDAAKKLGVKLVVQAAEREVDVEKQMQIIEPEQVGGGDSACTTVREYAYIRETKMRAWELRGFGRENLTLTDKPVPQPGPTDVLVRVSAVSLNYRDKLVAEGQYNPGMSFPMTQVADAVGEILVSGPQKQQDPPLPFRLRS